MRTVGQVVAGLSDVKALVPVLKALGAAHAKYDIRSDHFSALGKALVLTVEEGVGPEAWSKEVRDAWKKTFATIQSVMEPAMKDAGAHTSSNQAAQVPHTPSTPAPVAIVTPRSIATPLPVPPSPFFNAAAASPYSSAITAPSPNVAGAFAPKMVEASSQATTTRPTAHAAASDTRGSASATPSQGLMDAVAAPLLASTSQTSSASPTDVFGKGSSSTPQQQMSSSLGRHMSEPFMKPSSSAAAADKTDTSQSSKSKSLDEGLREMDDEVDVEHVKRLVTTITQNTMTKHFVIIIRFAWLPRFLFICSCPHMPCCSLFWSDRGI
jgi:hypothetical protein